MASKYEDKTNEELKKIFKEVCEELNIRREKENAEKQEKAIQEMKEEYEASEAKKIKLFRHRLIAEDRLDEEEVRNTSDMVIGYIRNLYGKIEDYKHMIERKDLAIKNNEESYRDLNNDYCKLLNFKFTVLNRLPEKILNKYKLN